MLWLYTHVYLLYNRSYINLKNNKHVAEKGGFEPPETPPWIQPCDLSNRGRGGKRQQLSSSSKSEPRTVTPLQRAKEFTGEELVVSSGKLVCNASREELKLKSSSVKNHIRSSKHIEGKKKDSKGARHRCCAKGPQC